MEIEKIGTVDLQKLKLRGRKFYIHISKETVESYDLHLGDTFKVKILEVRRKECLANNHSSAM